MHFAWHVAELQRRKRLPSSPKALYAKRGQREVQTWQQQMVTMDLWVHHTRRVASNQKSLRELKRQSRSSDRQKHGRK